MEACAGDNHLLPEQIWDAEDIPDRELFAGRASGSAQPLVWAHAEHLKLRRLLHDGTVFDRPPQTFRRYVEEDRSTTPYVVWRFNNKVRRMESCKVLRIETLAPATVHVGVDGWTAIQDVDAVDTGLGVWVTDLDMKSHPGAGSIEFTFYWPEVDRWEGVDFRIVLA